MKKAVYILANIVVALIGGWWLAQFVGTLPYEMPSWLDSAIRGGIRLTGSAQFDNTDDIETIAIIVTFLACSALVGVLLALANVAGRHMLSRQRRVP
jgi:putative effector of murein hydrolase